MRKGLILVVIILGLAMAFPFGAMAGPVVSLDVINWSPGANITGITGPTPNPLPSTQWAGVINISINGGPTLKSFCTENVVLNTSPQPYELLQIGALSKWEYAAYIANTYNTTNDPNTAAAAQLAIWEIVFDSATDAYVPGNLAAGNFQATGPTAIITQANSILAGLATANLTSFNENSWMIAVSPPGSNPNLPPEAHQNFLVQVNAPIPAAIWMLGSGIIGLVAVRRRAKQVIHS